MKKIILLALAFTFSIGMNAHAQQPKAEAATFRAAYIPGGYDDNDPKVQIVLEIVFPNNCYRLDKTKVDINYTTKTISVYGHALVYGGVCLDVLSPNHEVINLGMLPAGKYQVIQPGARHTRDLGEVHISKSLTASADDFLYAPISQAYFTYLRGRNGKEVPVIKIMGVFSTNCMKLKDTRVDVERNVIAVQPIAEMREGGCKDQRRVFEKTIDVSAVKPGRYLLHVRSLNAEAVNSLIDVTH